MADKRFLIVDIHNFSPVPDEIRDKFFEPYVTSKKEGRTGLGTHSAIIIAGLIKGISVSIHPEKRKHS